MTIGDLVKYNVDQYQHQVPGLIVGLETTLTDGTQYLCVQWFDWAHGQLAIENSTALVVVSKAE